ncbi:MAG: zf-HC2 domain-containing protein [Planctomycetes bacterium]|nr:zf-HC2 domain-containing protein [Planctomycetota bacterium]
MNCRQASRLLPLWVGRDLADASEAAELRSHLKACPECAMQQSRLQESLDALQSASTTSLPFDSGRPSLWPKLAMVLKEVPRRRDHFNGWIPAAAMAMAVALMVTVSAIQIRREMGDVWAVDVPTRNLFETDQRFAPGAQNDDVQVPGLVVHQVTPNF